MRKREERRVVERDDTRTPQTRRQHVVRTVEHVRCEFADARREECVRPHDAQDTVVHTHLVQGHVRQHGCELRGVAGVHEHVEVDIRIVDRRQQLDDV
jgi:hypothetical protein